jgi:hypothetical protein
MMRVVFYILNRVVKGNLPPCLAYSSTLTMDTISSFEMLFFFCGLHDATTQNNIYIYIYIYIL